MGGDTLKTLPERVISAKSHKCKVNLGDEVVYFTSTNVITGKDNFYKGNIHRPSIGYIVKNHSLSEQFCKIKNIKECKL